MNRRPPASKTLTFTPMQTRILQMLVHKGATEKQIARALRRSPATIHEHVKRIYAACGVHSRSELLSRVIQRIAPANIDLAKLLLQRTKAGSRARGRRG